MELDKTISKLILKAHHNLTVKVGKPEYAPTAKEIDGEIKRIIELDSEAPKTSLAAVFTIDDAKEVVRAWEALEGGRNYSAKAIEKWLANDMKPAIDKLRNKINGI